MTDTQLRDILTAMLADPKSNILVAYRAAIEMWLAQSEAAAAIKEAA
jgi:hypothetical protein